MRQEPSLPTGADIVAGDRPYTKFVWRNSKAGNSGGDSPHEQCPERMSSFQVVAGAAQIMKESNWRRVC